MFLLPFCHSFFHRLLFPFSDPDHCCRYILVSCPCDARMRGHFAKQNVRSYSFPIRTASNISCRSLVYFIFIIRFFWLKYVVLAALLLPFLRSTHSYQLLYLYACVKCECRMVVIPLFLIYYFSGSLKMWFVACAHHCCTHFVFRK